MNEINHTLASDKEGQFENFYLEADWDLERDLKKIITVGYSTHYTM